MDLERINFIKTEECTHAIAWHFFFVVSLSRRVHFDCRGREREDETTSKLLAGCYTWKTIFSFARRTRRASSFFSLFFLKKKVYWRGREKRRKGGVFPCTAHYYQLSCHLLQSFSLLFLFSFASLYYIVCILPTPSS